MQELKPVIFNLSGEKFGVDISVVRSIENEIQIFPAPNAPGYIRGIIHLRGEVVPVYNLKAKFNMPDDYDGEKNLIVVTAGNFPIALEVDGVENIKEIQKDQVFEAPNIVKTSESEFLQNVINIDDKLVMIIDPMKLLENNEKDSVQEMLEEVVI